MLCCLTSLLLSPDSVRAQRPERFELFHLLSQSYWNLKIHEALASLSLLVNAVPLSAQQHQRHRLLKFDYFAFDIEDRRRFFEQASHQLVCVASSVQVHVDSVEVFFAVLQSFFAVRQQCPRLLKTWSNPCCPYLTQQMKLNVETNCRSHFLQTSSSKSRHDFLQVV